MSGWVTLRRPQEQGPFLESMLNYIKKGCRGQSMTTAGVRPLHTSGLLPHVKWQEIFSHALQVCLHGGDA